MDVKGWTQLCLVLLWIKLLNDESVIHKWLIFSSSWDLPITGQIHRLAVHQLSLWLPCHLQKSDVHFLCPFSVQILWGYFFVSDLFACFYFLTLWRICFPIVTYLPSSSRSTGVKTLWGIFPGYVCSFWMASRLCQVFCFYYNIFLWFYLWVNPLIFLHHQNYWPLYKGLESWILSQLHNWHFAVGCRY